MEGGNRGEENGIVFLRLNFVILVVEEMLSLFVVSWGEKVRVGVL